MSLEILDLDPFDAAAFEAWHRVYLRAQSAMGEAATPWMLEELRAVMQQGGSSAWSGGWSAVVAGETVGAGFPTRRTSCAPGPARCPTSCWRGGPYSRRA